MSLKASIHKRIFQFSFNARTSRGTMKDKTSWFVKIWDDNKPEVVGIGECGPLPGLNPEHNMELETNLEELIVHFNSTSITEPQAELNSVGDFINQLYGSEKIVQYPSFLFALETALLDWAQGGEKIIFKNQFLEGEPIPINGLIWMGGLDFMLQQIEIKIRDGFTCLKLKVGSHDFEKECDVLQYIRRKYFRDKIIIRLDANGAFKADEALYKLKELARFNIHSIEQPIKPGQEELIELCQQSPIPIALDEELIGVSTQSAKQQLLESIKPQHIILKPTLHGGLQSCAEWIRISESLGIGWWITSALESNIGLNAIAQFVAQYQVKTPQGLGTGMIYIDNVYSPLAVRKGMLQSKKGLEWGTIDI
ncbi:MAG: o-succinylbenzoate synthase [Cyclobacteriaceae bacterium]|nr:o-succinylbenzoate synthase [Cyclobacteriaceae bacterium]